MDTITNKMVTHTYDFIFFSNALKIPYFITHKIGKYSYLQLLVFGMPEEAFFLTAHI